MENYMSRSNGRLLHHTSAEQRLRERLNEPDTAEALNLILDNAQLIALTVTSLDGMLRRSEQIMENVTESLDDLRAAVPSVDVNVTEVISQVTELSQFLPKLTDMISQLKALLDSDEFNSLTTSGLFAPKTLAIIGDAGTALVESYETSQRQVEPMGVLALANSLRDPDVQRVLTFLVDFSKRFGQSLNS